jgi:hypothetical protein
MFEKEIILKEQLAVQPDRKIAGQCWRWIIEGCRDTGVS